VVPTDLVLLGLVEEIAAIEQVPMQMTVFTARIGQEPRLAAEVAALGWTNGTDGYAPLLAPAVSAQVIPLLRSVGRM
jgi:8-oxo-dGTP diphosphatase